MKRRDGKHYFRLTKADCLWAAKKAHPIFAVRRLWPRSKFPAGHYPTLRRAFRRHGVYYPWPERLPRGWGCVQRAMGLAVPESPRKYQPSNIRAVKERKALRGRPLPKAVQREAARYVRPADIWLQAMRDAMLPPYNGTCSIIENQEAK